MRAINKMVLRKVWRMKVRTLGISMVVCVAAAMFITGLYTADVLEYSTESFVKDSKMPDLFIDFSSPVNASDVEPVLASIGVRTYDLRLKMVGVNDPARKDINLNTLDTGRFFQAPGECFVVSGGEGIGAKTGSVAQFYMLGKTLNLTVTGTAKNPEYAMAGYMTESSVPVPTSIVVAFMSLSELQNT
jgi:hypothetical protein